MSNSADKVNIDFNRNNQINKEEKESIEKKDQKVNNDNNIRRKIESKIQ